MPYLAARLQIKQLSGVGTMTTTSSEQLVVCLDNEGNTASLERRKIYVALPDLDADKHGLLRVIDESGEDYLYPKACFGAITLPAP
jgi:hypothetical protein